MLTYVIALLQIPFAILAFNNSTEQDDQRVHCPKPDSATSSCDAPTLFTYYTCCGEENMFCCMRIQLHVVIFIVVVLVVLLLVAVSCFVSWICRIRRKGHQSYDFS